MLHLPVMDFETRSEAGYLWTPPTAKHPAGRWASLPGFSDQKRGLAAVGVRVYVEHPTFTPLLLMYDLTPEYSGTTAVQWELGQPFDCLAPLFEYIRAGGLIEAQNAGFEYQVWNYFCVPKWNWPRLHIRQLRCSAVKARAAGYPGKLGPLTIVLDTPIKKDKEGERLMKLFSIPRQPSKKDPRTFTLPHEAPVEWAAYKSYNLTDGQSEFQASSRLPPFPPEEQELWFLDQEINDRGMAVDRRGIRDCIYTVNAAFGKYGTECRALTGLEATQGEKLKDWLHARGCHMDDLTEETIAATIERLQPVDGIPYVDPQVLSALELRQMLSSASVKKLFALDAATASDGRVHDMYQMHATHHGRTGGYGPQPANLYSGEWHTPAEVNQALQILGLRSLAAVEMLYPTRGPLTVVNNCLRSLFVAGPGMELISSDYTAIEGVVLAALAGEEWILDVFRTHGLYYEAQIARMTGRDIEEFIRYKRDTGKHHPLRQQGKLAVLSGGYASWIGGWKKFGADKYYPGGDAEIKAAIMSYRDSVPKIVEFWGGQTRDKFKPWERQELYGLEGAAIRAIQDPTHSWPVGLITFQMDVASDTLLMQLPSGRLIRYHTPRLMPATRQYASEWELAISYMGWNTNPDKGPVNQWIQQDLYGGVLTQNATGGTARDIMMHGLRNVTEDGYPIVMHTYDEAVAEVPAGWGHIEEFEEGLNDLPAYARGWPVRAKGGWRGPRYGKWD